MAYFLHQLNVIGWPGGRGLNSLEHQLVNRWQQLLEEIADLDAVAGAVTHQQAYQLLYRLIEKTIFQPQSRLKLPFKY